MATTVREFAALDDLYKFVEPLDLVPAWVPQRHSSINAKKDRSVHNPGHWRYADARCALEAAGRLVDVALAERRNLVLRNRGTEGEDWATTRTLVSAFQMILPGETAPSHVHASNALRVIIEGNGAYSVVDGVKMPMNEGDVVLTPGGHFHGHGHEGDAPAYWLDCLDVPMSHLLEAMYMTPHPEKYEPIKGIATESPYRFTRNNIARDLDSAAADPEGNHGPRIILPTPSMPSVGLAVERLESGRAFRRNRSSANRLYSVMSGSGMSRVDDKIVQWAKGDAFTVPAAYWAEHRAESDAVLVEMSDEPLMRFTNHLIIEIE